MACISAPLALPAHKKHSLNFSLRRVLVDVRELVAVAGQACVEAIPALVLVGDLTVDEA
jgi:hypothetical protein